MALGSSAGPVLVLVDGSNVARSDRWCREQAHVDHGGIDRAHGQALLVDAVASWAARGGHDVLLVFDGAGPFGAGTVTVAPGIDVAASGGAHEGDELLERAAADARRAGRSHWLVTGDRALIGVAGAQADRVIDPDSFVRELLGSARVEGSGAAGEPAHPGDASSQGPSGSTSGLAGRLDPHTRARLEQLRRGRT